MGSIFQAFVLIVAGIFLLWFGYSIIFGIFSRSRMKKNGAVTTGIPGAPRTCPVCSAKLVMGEKVKSTAFPSLAGYDRLMYISGCVFCMEGDRTRSCPVCKEILLDDEFLIARLFDKPHRSHVHVVGCSHCRGPQSRRPLPGV